ncbi:chitinase [Luteimicrobium subarcticum]|uniref:chitinase n=1 Tax=Luteimicrobium subarcticum TaxID=620910 RepID=UPI0012FD0D95|nr:chitinase [Luteimicrobium subarcticum]
MKRSVFLSGAALAASALVAIGPLASSATAQGGSGDLRPGLPLPLHVSAPYLDVTAVDSIAQTAKDSGNKYMTLAFLQTDEPGSCDLYWAGNKETSVADGAYKDEIAAIRKAGGDVIISFGGYNATNDTTTWAGDPAQLHEIADSCTDVHKIAQAYEKVVTTYGVTRLDMDIEGDSIKNTPGVERRNAAIAELQRWAVKNHRVVDVTYTLPSTPNGLVQTGKDLVSSAKAHGAVIRTFNVMTFDYWDGAQHDMVADAQTAATGLLDQVHELYAPRVPKALLWNAIGVVQMNGIDDFGPTETLSVDQAKTFQRWATQKHLGYIGFWAVQRDHQGTDCVGVKGAWNCSGVEQGDWAFSKAFAPFTSWWP